MRKRYRGNFLTIWRLIKTALERTTTLPITVFGSARPFRRIGLPEYGDNGESCIGCNSQTDEE